MTPDRKRVTNGRDDAGSAAVELTLLTPLLILVLMFVVALGRLAQARINVNDAAHQAARAASLARDPATAGQDARSVAVAVLGGHTQDCHTLTVTTDTAEFRPGGEAIVTVQCTVNLSDLSLLRLPGRQTITARFSSPIDEFRSQILGLTRIPSMTPDPR